MTPQRGYEHNLAWGLSGGDTGHRRVCADVPSQGDALFGSELLIFNHNLQDWEAHPMPLDQPVLQQGDIGDAVARLQEDLATVGYFMDAVDGVLGTQRLPPLCSSMLISHRSPACSDMHPLEQTAAGRMPRLCGGSWTSCGQRADDIKRRVQ